MLHDTIVALSSAAGSGARAIVRLSGVDTRRIVATLFGPFEPQQHKLLRGSLQLSGVRTPLPATLYFFPHPHSYTGEDLAELHVPGSPPLVERLIADLLNAGARAAGPGEFTQRAFLAGKLDLTRAEAVQAVIDSRGDDLKTALAQLAGNVARPLDVLRNDLLNLLADVEAALDFVDEDIEFVSQSDTLKRITQGLAQLTNLDRQLSSRTVSGTMMRVALAGEPNAGKSTLFNALTGGNALVSPIAGTTRDYLKATITLGTTFELIDTAGLEDWRTGSVSDRSIDHHAQSLATELLQTVDLILWCVPVGTHSLPPRLAAETIIIRTKSDLAACDGLAVSTFIPDGLAPLTTLLAAKADAWTPPLAPSQSRVRHHVTAALASLRRAHEHSLNTDPAELLALALREALDSIGAMAGSVYTNDLLDRIFSRFCIGK